MQAQPSAPQASAEGSITYDAPAQCPDERAWLSGIGERLGGDGGAAWAELERLVASVVVDAAGTAARIRFRGSEAERIITGQDCAEVVSAAALILAIAVSPHAAQPNVEAPPSAEFEVSAPAPNAMPPMPAPDAGLLHRSTLAMPASPARAEAVSAAPAATSAAPIPSSPHPPDAIGVDSTSAAPRAHRMSTEPWSFAVGVGAEANNWIGPWPAGVFEASLEAVAPARTWSARLAGSFGMADRGIQGRQAEFRFWGGHLDVCPLSVGHEAWRWASCMEARLGVLQASGEQDSALARGRTQSAWWAGLELGMRLLTPPIWALRFEAEAAFALPLSEREFRFGAPDQLVFETPGIGITGRAGVQIPLGGAP